MSPLSFLISYAVFYGLARQVLAIPSLPRPSSLQARQNDTITYSLPDKHDHSALRAQAIRLKRDNFIYGPSIAGNTSFWPTGPLGDATVQTQFAALVADGAPQRAAVQADSATAVQAVIAVSQDCTSYNATWGFLTN
jgi:hypothetical protein